MEKTYKIHKLDQSKNPTDFKMIVELLAEQSTNEILAKIDFDYLPWDEFRKKSWVTDQPENYWQIVTMNRNIKKRHVPIKDKSGIYYAFDPHRHIEFLHEVDLELGGNMLGISDFSEADKRQIIRRNLIEESIASSKLEGANTSREAARQMLKAGRRANDKDELMIINNHAAMTWIEEVGKHQKLTVDILLELHQRVTAGTLKDSSLEGQLRNTLDANGNRLKIMPWDETTVVYVVPDRDFVDEQLPLLVAFANDADGSPFIHPLIKAIMLHFWIGLLHPFEDGNGRLARVIFYWYILRKGYWAFSYITLSERILKSPKQYAMAYINSEQDNYDLNYFIQYNIEKLMLARQHLQTYLKAKILENKQRIRVAGEGHGLNARQIRLLQQLYQGEQPYISLAEHSTLNPEITYMTASNDLRALVESELLRKVKNGRNVNYFTTPKVETLFK